MTTIVFIRHGESDSNVLLHQSKNDINLSSKISALGDPGLSELGEKQALAVGEYLRTILGPNQKVKVLTSLFSRTKQTAEPFCNLHKDNVEVFHLESLNEYTRPTKYLSQAHLDAGLKHHKEWSDFTNQIEEFVNSLEALAQSNVGSVILIFGHSLFISVMVSYLGSHQTFMPDKSQLVFRFPNCSITTMRYSLGNWKLLNVGSIAHLPENLNSGVECPFGTAITIKS